MGEIKGLMLARQVFDTFGPYLLPWALWACVLAVACVLELRHWGWVLDRIFRRRVRCRYQRLGQRVHHQMTSVSVLVSRMSGPIGRHRPGPPYLLRHILNTAVL